MQRPTEKETNFSPGFLRSSILLEISYATWMAQMSTVEIAEFGRQFEQRLRTTWPLAVEVFGHRSESSPEVLREEQAISARFWKKAQEKDRDIRLGPQKLHRNGWRVASGECRDWKM